VCGSSSGLRAHSMPNSVVTTNLFWLSSNNTAGATDQVKIYTTWPGAGAGQPCSP
jgi:hypothetical protein